METQRQRNEGKGIFPEEAPSLVLCFRAHLSFLPHNVKVGPEGLRKLATGVSPG